MTLDASAPPGASVQLDASQLTLRQLNVAIRAGLAEGRSVVVSATGARHNLGVALLQPGWVTFDGSVGYYCAGMNDGATVRIGGSAGWGVAEGMLSGTVVVEGNAGNGAAASIRGGTVVVKGDCASRAGVSMKGGLLLIGGDAGYMTGFMMQKGTIAILGSAGEALADSMYEGVILVGGEIASLGNDAVIESPLPEDVHLIEETCRTNGIAPPDNLRRVVAGRKLWNFHQSELDTWREAL
ncbi:MAG: glutamate synthase [Chloroflexota bacterium]|nr:glutamate synthase [Chloroflexota bacterium]